VSTEPGPAACPHPRARSNRRRLLARLTAAALAAAVLATAGSAVTVAEAGNRWSPTGVRTSRQPPNSTFSIAVMPDTQMEVHEATDTRFRERSQWLVDHAAELDLRYVTHTGDVVDWDTPDHAQTAIASAALRPLEAARIPYSLTIGNHDTQATGVGGSARDPSRTRILQRDTTVFNSFFTAARYGAVRGAFEPNKVDNIYSTFTAGRARWLVLNLELWPRVAAVNWARNVVASHSGYNVIIATHSYLNADTTLSTSSGYGDTSPQYLFDNLIKVYPNVKMVFSGHAGTAGERVDVGVHGNKIVSYLQTFHSRTTNPVRLVEVNTATGTIATRIYAPRDRATYPQFADGERGMAWVKLPES
jgi:calcineurin-like phosphoesterase family protein